MRYTGSAEFAAHPERVWDFLIDPSHLGPCSPVPIERVDDTHFRAQAKLGSGFFSTTVKVDLEVVDVDPGRSARFVGRGGASGTTVEGSTTFRVESGAIEGTTVVDWDAEFTLAGMFASAAAKVIEQNAPEAMERLLACIRGQVEAEGQSA